MIMRCASLAPWDFAHVHGYLRTPSVSFEVDVYIVAHALRRGSCGWSCFWSMHKAPSQNAKMRVLFNNKTVKQGMSPSLHIVLNINHAMMPTRGDEGPRYTCVYALSQARALRYKVPRPGYIAWWPSPLLRLSTQV